MSNFDKYGNILVYSMNENDKKIILKSLRTGEYFDLKDDQTIISTEVIQQSDVNVYNKFVNHYKSNRSANRLKGIPCPECKVTLYDILRIGTSEEVSITCYNGHHADSSMIQ